MNIRTDLAIECREMFAGEIAGVESINHDRDGISVTHVKITTPEGALKIGKPIGNYITIEIKQMNLEDEEICERGAQAVCDELKKIISVPEDASVLVAGLGNQYITPDSIGPKTVGKLLVTRHITSEGNNGHSFDVRAVSALAPGVLGLTGIETGEVIQGVADRVKPSLIIAVDALASRKLSRLGTTVQIADTGISPGSGVGNNRKELTEKTLGVPVIAIGVPMVVDAATLTMDAMETLSQHMSKNFSKNAEELVDAFEHGGRKFINEALSKESTNMIVTPNDVDVISNQAAEIIAEGINRALHIK